MIILGFFFRVFEVIRSRAMAAYNLARINVMPHEHKNELRKPRISGNCILKNPKNIYIGQGSYINGGIICAGMQSKIKIGCNCLLSYNLHIRADTHQFDDTMTPIMEQGNREADIIIADNIWIGAGVQIMCGCTIGAAAQLVRVQ